MSADLRVPAPAHPVSFVEDLQHEPVVIFQTSGQDSSQASGPCVCPGSSSKVMKLALKTFFFFLGRDSVEVPHVTCNACY